LLAIVVCAAAGVALIDISSATAQMSEQDQAKRWFLEHDRDHDGYVTLDEVMRRETELFNRMGPDSAGRLREDQYCAGIPAYKSADIKRCHDRFTNIEGTSSDGYISLDDIGAYYRAILQKADQNHDGRVTLNEWLAIGEGY
jgi:Ca2+-binding EF-hand superfamily protein